MLPLYLGLLEIRAVALETVAIKDINSVRYLCMGPDGRMRGLVSVRTGQGDIHGQGCTQREFSLTSLECSFQGKLSRPN